ncbi:hypothetical protein [Methylobacterium sp. J-068]|uniref:hypothetical protein n=1 Tax=Methylobacterium sp. J-068 TaxID=2836649 RepID=UPI001FBA2071|nr:hypothetical protein [Methylobacterium sp. J-068]MCJ2035438.1 hypothetical protein [Methylobacterium sp. J-068]
MSFIRIFAGLATALIVLGGSAYAAEPDAGPGRAVTLSCDGPAPCRPGAAPGPADRAVRPFKGSLGRPCAYRWRATPQGTRKVRVCF